MKKRSKQCYSSRKICSIKGALQDFGYFYSSRKYIKVMTKECKVFKGVSDCFLSLRFNATASLPERKLGGPQLLS